MSKPEGDALVAHVVEWALRKKAEDLAVLDLRGVMDVTDFFVLATGASPVQVQAIGDSIEEGTIAAGVKPISVEGRDGGRWILLDYVDVVVHVMLPDVRRYYSLERLWGDAVQTRYDEMGRPLPATPRAGAGVARP